MRMRDTALALLIVLIWGLNFVAIRWGVDWCPPLLLTCLRYVLAAVPAVFLVRRPAVALPVLIAYGFCVGALQFGFLFSAIGLGMPAGLASMVMQTQAFFTLFIAVAVLGEKPGLFQLWGAGVAFLGIATIASGRLGGATLVPLLMTLAAALFWGISNILNKRAGRQGARIDMFAFVVWSALVPPIPLFVLSLMVEGPEAIGAALSNPSVPGVLSLLFIAYASTLVGYGGWSSLLGRYPVSTVAPYSLLVPVAGLGSAAVLLGEPLSAIEYAGSALVFIGLLINVFGPRLRQRWQARLPRLP